VALGDKKLAALTRQREKFIRRVAEVSEEIEALQSRMAANATRKTGPIAARRKATLELRAKGFTFRQIGEALGVGAHRASQIYRQAERDTRRKPRI
jgi:hypothetical protein